MRGTKALHEANEIAAARKRRDAARKRAKQITEDRELRVAKAIRLARVGSRVVKKLPWEELEECRPNATRAYLRQAKAAIAECNK